jgi:hypothetical protein
MHRSLAFEVLGDDADEVADRVRDASPTPAPASGASCGADAGWRTSSREPGR